MPKMRDLRRVGDEFLDDAPVANTLRQRLPVGAGTAFRCLEDADAWPQWLDPIDEVVWTSPRPFGVGTTRDVQGRAGKVSEEFFAWEDGRRMAFMFTAASNPVFAAFAESYELTPLGDDECELAWRHAFECGRAFRLLQPVIAFGFGRMATRALGKLERHLREHGATYG